MSRPDRPSPIANNGALARHIPLALATVVACGGNHTITTVGPAASQRVELAGFRAIRSTPLTIDTSSLLEDALSGTVEHPNADLGSRMQRRAIDIPTPPPGGSTRFNFAGTRRGWVAVPGNRDILPTPAFSGGKIIVGGGFGSRSVLAFDAYSGEAQWALTAEDGGPSSAIVDDGKVIFNAESCKIFVADAASGKLLWKKWLGDPLMSVPVSAGGLVMTGFPSGGGHVFAAFDLDSGAERWRLAIPNDVLRTPQVHGDSVYFATLDGTAFRVRRADGKKIWESSIGASSALWVEGGRVHLTRKVAGKKNAPAEQPIALSAKTGKIVSRGERRAAPYLGGASRDRQLVSHQQGAWGSVRDSGHLGLVNVAAAWSFQGSSPVLAAGRSYLAIGGDIVARDLASGETLWRRHYKEAAGAQALTPPAVVGSQLLFGSVDGHLYIADIDTGMAIRAYDIGEPIVTQPIVAQGWVYLTTGKGRLIGLELGDPMWGGWHMWGGNPTHTGLVAGAGAVDPHLLASLERPGRGTLEADGGAELPLLHSRVSAELSGAVARVSVTQRFENPGDKPVEAVYTFPLPADAAVDDMVMRVGDRVIRAKIKEKKKARKTYEAAKKAGKRAALLEQQRPDLFAQRVANIAPGASIEVSLRYVHPVPFEAGTYEFRFPMVARRRAGDDGAGEARAADVDLDVDVDAGVPIAAIESPSHRVSPEREPGRARVRLRDAAADRDFVLRYRLGGAAPTAALHAHRAGEAGYFDLLLQPPATMAPAQVGRRELILAIDTSGSMRGRAIEHARAIARRALAGLGPDDRFNVFWGSHRLAPQPLAGSRENIARGVAAIDAIEAGSGADALEALLAALAAKPAGGDRTRVVAPITDGFLGNEAGVLRAIAKTLGRSRLYPVGVGSAVDAMLLDRAAELGGGRAMRAELSEDPEAVARRFSALVEKPVFTDVDIDWGGLDVSDVYPRRLPDLYAGTPLVVRGRFGRGGEATVAIRGTMGGKRYERQVEVTLPGAKAAAAPGSAQEVLWARAAIRDRMDRLALRDDPKVIREVKDLGLRHRLVTQWTSFVAVDDAAVARAAAPPPPPKAQVSVTPAAALPGDPEIRIPAPADARAVTVILPFGETVAATYDDELELWTARFLIPSDAGDGSYPIDVVTTLAGGAQQRDRVWYEVDSSAPLVAVEVVGDPRPGHRVTLRARQTLTRADRRRAGGRPLSAAQIQLLSDARRVTARAPGGQVVPFEVAAPGVWEAEYVVPPGASGELRFEVVVVDLAANIRTQPFAFEVAR